jgi:probable F420-dependent oxidoreductase
MQFGVSLPLVQQMPGQPDWQKDDDPAQLVAVARKADELGYAWVPCSDHVIVPRRALPAMGASWYAPATTLAFIAGFTQRLRLLTHVLVLPYRNPLDIAKQYATLDRLSAGRVILGVGVGHLRAEFRALRAEFEDRGAVTDEYIEVIKRLWTNEEASFRGRYVEFSELHLSPRPVQQPHPPIWVGGNSRRAARRAVELGDGWLPWDVTPADLRDRLDYVRRLPAFEQRRAPLDIVVPGGPFDLDAPNRVVEEIAAYRDAGVTGMTVGFVARSLEEQLERMEQFAREIAPTFS